MDNQYLSDNCKSENIFMKINSCKELAYRMDHSKPN